MRPFVNNETIDRQWQGRKEPGHRQSQPVSKKFLESQKGTDKSTGFLLTPNVCHLSDSSEVTDTKWTYKRATELWLWQSLSIDTPPQPCPQVKTPCHKIASTFHHRCKCTRPSNMSDLPAGHWDIQTPSLCVSVNWSFRGQRGGQGTHMSKESTRPIDWLEFRDCDELEHCQSEPR